MTITDRVAAPLPRGRHALTRGEVRASQRTRLLRAMTVEVAQRGYAATTAAGVYQRAGVSSRAFYENFSSLHDCFLAAYEANVAILQSRLGSVSDGRDPPLQRLVALLDAYLSTITQEPDLARIFLVEVYAAGGEALAHRLAVHQRFVETVIDALADEKLSEADHFAVEILVAAVTFQATMHVIAQEHGDLRELRTNLVAMATRLCPWLQDFP